MILTATEHGLGTLWIANTCFAYNELVDFIKTDNQLTGIWFLLILFQRA